MQSRYKFQPGDVFEIKTPVGLGFFQYTHQCAGMGELVRVLPGLYKSRPEHLSGLVHQQELYYVHVTLEAACQECIVCKVGHEKLPKSATSFPIMRKPGMPNAEGTVPVWFIGNGAKMSTLDDMRQLKKVAVLTADQRRLSIKVLWPPNVMVERIAWGWTPERDDEFRKAATAGSSDVESGGPRMVEHFLYFPQEPNAHRRSAGA